MKRGFRDQVELVWENLRLGGVRLYKVLYSLSAAEEMLLPDLSGREGRKHTDHVGTELQSALCDAKAGELRGDLLLMSHQKRRDTLQTAPALTSSRRIQGVKSSTVQNMPNICYPLRGT